MDLAYPEIISLPCAHHASHTKLSVPIVDGSTPISRSKMGNIRFDNVFPFHGGGEDIDFCIRVTGDGRWHKAIPDAIVRHGWWGNGRRSYRRFFRWAFGDCILAPRFPKYRYYDAPNAVESVIFGLPIVLAVVAAGAVSPLIPPLWLGCVVISEIMAEQVRVKMTADNMSFVPGLESTVIRASNDLGRVCGILRRGKPLYLFSRFDYLGTWEWLPSSKAMNRTRFAAIAGSLMALLLV